MSYTVEMTNTGEMDMLIEFVTASCGCTIPDDWDTDAIEPGATTSFEVLFTGKPEHLEEVAAQGFVEQRIDILANTKPEVTEFRIRAKVVE